MMKSNRKSNKQLYFILNQNQIHINNNIMVQPTSKPFAHFRKNNSNVNVSATKTEDKKKTVSLSKGVQMNNFLAKHKKPKEKNKEDLLENKYYFRLQKLLDNQVSHQDTLSNGSRKPHKKVDTYISDDSQDSSLPVRAKQNAISFKNLNSGADFLQSRNSTKFASRNSAQMKDLVTNQQKINKIIEQTDPPKSQPTLKKEKSVESKNSQRFMSKTDVQQLEDFVSEKMNFGLVDPKKKYIKDPLNDRENDIDILKTMRDFTYFENTQSTLDFKSRFNIGKIIGQGAYAQVREAIDNTQQKKVAIKIYKKEKLAEGQRLRGVRREVAILVTLRKLEAVGGLLDLVETRNHVNIIMEFCEGKDIYQNMKSRYNRRLEKKECQKVFYQLAYGLNQLHQLGVGHRDIKLENILLSIQPSGDIKTKIIDFGFSTCQLKSQKNRIFCGTPSYMAPEIVSKTYYQAFSADVWALGVVLYAMLTGDFPFKGKSDRELYSKICAIKISYPESVPPAAQKLMERIFQFEPKQRPSCQELLNDPWLNEVHAEEWPSKSSSFGATRVSTLKAIKNSAQEQQFNDFLVFLLFFIASRKWASIPTLPAPDSISDLYLNHLSLTQIDYALPLTRISKSRLSMVHWFYVSSRVPLALATADPLADNTSKENSALSYTHCPFTLLLILSYCPAPKCFLSYGLCLTNYTQLLYKAVFTTFLLLVDYKQRQSPPPSINTPANDRNLLMPTLPYIYYILYCLLSSISYSLISAHSFFLTNLTYSLLAFPNNYSSTLSSFLFTLSSFLFILSSFLFTLSSFLFILSSFLFYSSYLGWSYWVAFTFTSLSYWLCSASLNVILIFGPTSANRQLIFHSLDDDGASYLPPS